MPAGLVVSQINDVHFSRLACKRHSSRLCAWFSVDVVQFKVRTLRRVAGSLVCAGFNSARMMSVSLGRVQLLSFFFFLIFEFAF